jgi:hypothetical protein
MSDAYFSSQPKLKSTSSKIKVHKSAKHKYSHVASRRHTSPKTQIPKTSSLKQIPNKSQTRPEQAKHQVLSKSSVPSQMQFPKSQASPKQVPSKSQESPKQVPKSQNSPSPQNTTFPDPKSPSSKSQVPSPKSKTSPKSQAHRQCLRINNSISFSELFFIFYFTRNELKLLMKRIYVRSKIQT